MARPRRWSRSDSSSTPAVHRASGGTGTTNGGRRTTPRSECGFGAQITVESDVFLGGVQTICETGEAIGADMIGSRQMAYTYGPPKVVWVAGINTLVPDVQTGLRRTRELAMPSRTRA